MAEEKTYKVDFVDKDHCWINNQQFVSLRRFLQVKAEHNRCTELLINEMKALAEENEAYKILLKEKLNE